jgi:cytochrome c peroxidase
MPLYLKIAVPVAGLILGIFSLTVPKDARSQPPEAPPDAIAQAQTPREAAVERPEQRKTVHDLSDIFNPSNAVPSSEALTNQTDRGQMLGFDFYRDPLGATRPGMTFEDFYRAGVANKPQVMALTAVQLDGLRLLVTPFPQEEFNPTDDRRTVQPSLGVTCLDCHTNGHTSGQFHITPDIRPEQRRIRLDTVSLRGLFNQHIHGSKRSLRSVEDFTEFEQRTAYFNGDAIHALKKGMNILDRIQVTNMAQMQNMFDFPPAPKLTVTGMLDPAKATAGEIAGEKLFFGKAQCSTCHPAPVYLDNQMHDLHVERFLKSEAGDGPIKAFTLRGIKDSPPYLHDGRLLTLEDTVEFFNLVLELKLTPEEKHNLVEFMRQL